MTNLKQGNIILLTTVYSERLSLLSGGVLSTKGERTIAQLIGEDQPIRCGAAIAVRYCTEREETERYYLNISFVEL